jgi:hypothetical protein
MTDEAAGPSRKRAFHLLLIAAGAVAVILLAIFLAPASRSSTRVQAVEKLIQVSRAGDGTAFAGMVLAGADFMPLFDVVSSLTAESLAEFTQGCRIRDFAEGLDTVAVKFDCARETGRAVIIDFTFCGARIGSVHHVELGRWTFSPLVDDLIDRAIGNLPRVCDGKPG